MKPLIMVKINPKEWAILKENPHGFRVFSKDYSTYNQTFILFLVCGIKDASVMSGVGIAVINMIQYKRASREHSIQLTEVSFSMVGFTKNISIDDILFSA